MNVVRSVLPVERVWLLAILAVALVYPAHHLLFYLFPPEGYVFNGGHGDEGTALALLVSAESGFADPWSLEGKTFFSNPTIPSAFVLIPLGSVAALLRIDYALFLIVLKFFLSCAYLVVLYHLTKHFAKAKGEFTLAFFILLLASGLGAVLQMPAAVATGNYSFAGLFPSSYGLSADDSGFTILSQFQHLYRLISLCAGYAALYLFIRKRRYAPLLLGLSVLAHPFLGAVAVAQIAGYALLCRRPFMPLLAVSALFFLPWGLVYLENPAGFSAAHKEEAFLPAVLLSGGVPLAFALYFLARRAAVPARTAAAALLASGAALSVAQLSLLGISSLELDQWLYLLLQLPFFVCMALAALLLRKEKDKERLFLMTLLLAVFAFSVAPSGYVPWFPFRLLHFLWFPAALLAARGLLTFASLHKLDARKLFALVAAVSVPWLIAFNLNFQLHAREVKYPDFFHEEERAALEFLKLQPRGVVLSSGEIGSYLPYFTGQTSLMGGTIAGEAERKKDYRIFFSAHASDEERRAILEKYEISYVFYGYKEKAGGSTLAASDYLTELYKRGDVELFSVAR